ncbi:hypothetical protein SDC9_178404 [bioreactor metagenome]|uniref:Uncharacterized protein n=1 Tax=bioreactor metagenome TaxID=1076179 RepID=A0A645H509_9ZZZZ
MTLNSFLNMGNTSPKGKWKKCPNPSTMSLILMISVKNTVQIVFACTKCFLVHWNKANLGIHKV